MRERSMRPRSSRKAGSRSSRRGARATHAGPGRPRRVPSGRSAALALALGLVAVISATSCATVRLVSDYDEVTDQRVTALQRDVGSHLETLRRVHLEPDRCGHAEFVGFYEEALVDVDALLVRNRVRTKNDQTTESLELLRDSLEALEELHAAKDEGRCMTPDELAPLKEAFETSFAAILKLELAKKRGEEE